MRLQSYYLNIKSMTEYSIVSSRHILDEAAYSRLKINHCDSKKILLKIKIPVPSRWRNSSSHEVDISFIKYIQIMKMTLHIVYWKIFLSFRVVDKTIFTRIMY